MRHWIMMIVITTEKATLMDTMMINMLYAETEKKGVKVKLKK